MKRSLVVAVAGAIGLGAFLLGPNVSADNKLGIGPTSPSPTPLPDQTVDQFGNVINTAVCTLRPIGDLVTNGYVKLCQPYTPGGTESKIYTGSSGELTINTGSFITHCTAGYAVHADYTYTANDPAYYYFGILDWYREQPSC